MNNRIESFPIINENVLLELSVNLELLEGEYSLDNKLEFIKDEENENVYILDNNGIWSKDSNDLCIKGKLKLNNYNILFNEYRVAKEDTILGVALTYISKGSSKTYSKPIGEIKFNEAKEKNIDFILNFEPGEIASNIELRFLIYVKEVQSGDNDLFASNSGTIIGEIYNCNLIIEGQGSDFPIVIIDNLNAPLWDMYVEFESLEDVFSKDSICLRINQAHKQFAKLGIDKISLNNNLIWKEILASFFTNIFIVSQQICSIDTIFYDDVQEGTVGGFLKFIIITFNILPNELSNPIELSNKIRKNLDKVL